MASPLGDAKLLKLLVHALEAPIVLQDRAIQNSAYLPVSNYQLRAWLMAIQFDTPVLNISSLMNVIFTQVYL